MTKKIDSAINAINGIIKDGMTIMVGGFGLCGIPENSIAAIASSGVKNLTIISNNCGVDDFGLGILLKNRQIKKMISSYVGENKNFAAQYLSNELKVELIPQGTLAEKIRAGGAGIPALYTRAGVGTEVAIGKEVRTFNGKEYILEKSFFADISFIKADIGDEEGNLIYRKTARNFNPLMATASYYTVVEVDTFAALGSLDKDKIHTPGIYVKKIFAATSEKRIEKIKIAGTLE